MSDELPADVLATADAAWNELASTPAGVNARSFETRIIARAIFSERVRCAEAARRMLVFADTTSGADEAIPQAIMDPEHWATLNPALIKELITPEAS